VLHHALDAARQGAQHVHHHQPISTLACVTLVHLLNIGMEQLANHAQQAVQRAVVQQQAALHAQAQTI